ncbi:hypothetical protein crov440 [Cafeteria roenbergensis virus]|uniref:Uncharacterized protein n=1 Tax=Cafeteria roenbergensis virus (strain BV-PW1) TaxID=693272 RepID=E3T5L1_CROVB|nr:hypothetical protein crov440 [Cafeteria roenbergensis virus BV-PW1]ADO67474.1 hypothetical protein crov440 [Cafeteria roenbergensis virus BV-PW1]
MESIYTNTTNIIDDLIIRDENSILSFIKENKNFNFNSKDSNGNYFIQQLIIKNYYKTIRELLNSISNLELDILDQDSRSICYYIIRFNRTEILDLLLNKLDDYLGFPYFELKDIEGNYSLSYCIIFNNIKFFKIIYNSNKVDIYKKNEMGESIFHLALKLKRNDIIKFLIDQKFNLNQTTKNNENLAHYILTYNIEFAKILTLLNLSDKETNFGLTPLHLICINYPDVLEFIKLDSNNINIVDYYGNTPIFYLLIENHLNIFKNIITNYTNIIDFNLKNIDGDTISHLILEKINNISNLTIELLKKILIHSNLNLQNNQGKTILHLLVENKIDLDIISSSIVNPFILDNDGNNILDISTNKKETIIKISKILSNFLQNNKTLAYASWEKECIVKNKCQEKILNYLNLEKKIPPFSQVDTRKIILDNNIPVKQCQFAGINLDILCGLKFIFNETKIHNFLEYPLTINKPLINFFKEIGIDLEYKIDFLNIQIYWAYQKLFFPTFIDSENEIKNLQKTDGFTIIPLGIELENGGHANIIIIDHKNKIIERFEPNGSNPPIDFKYNPHRLDNLLKNKFSILKYKYLPPDKYLPAIGFQFLESLETQSCNIGDPNGFCAVWCVWWAFHKIINNIESKILVEKLIHKIKLENYSFKSIIRNFSTKISDLRDKYLQQIGLDINKWIQGKYNLKLVNQFIDNIEII